MFTQIWQENELASVRNVVTIRPTFRVNITVENIIHSWGHLSQDTTSEGEACTGIVLLILQVRNCSILHRI